MSGLAVEVVESADDCASCGCGVWPSGSYAG